MKSFLVQFADGYFLAPRPVLATALASFAMTMDFASAFEAASRVPGARVVELQPFGSYAAESLEVVPLGGAF